MIDFTFLEGRDNEIVKELAVADSQIIGSRHVFKRPYGWEEVSMFNARMNQAIGHGCNWNNDVPYSELETVHREVAFPVTIISLDLRKQTLLAV